jgi:hypothetical protein
VKRTVKLNFRYFGEVRPLIDEYKRAYRNNDLENVIKTARRLIKLGKVTEDFIERELARLCDPTKQRGQWWRRDAKKAFKKKYPEIDPRKVDIAAKRMKGPK